MGHSHHPNTTVLAVVFALAPILASLTLGATSWLAARGRIQRNQWVGIRTPSTMRSDRAWIAGHRASLRVAPLYILVTLATCIALYIAVNHAPSFKVVTIIGLSGFAATIVLAVLTAYLASKAARSVDGQ